MSPLFNPVELQGSYPILFKQLSIIKAQFTKQETYSQIYIS